MVINFDGNNPGIYMNANHAGFIYVYIYVCVNHEKILGAAVTISIRVLPTKM